MDKQSNPESGIWTRLTQALRHPAGFLLSAALPGCVLSVLFRWLTPPQPDEELAWMAELTDTRALVLWIAVMAAALAALGYGIWALARKKQVANPAWVAVSVFYSGWMMLVLSALRSGFSLSTTDPWLLVCALCMLPVFYSMANVVLWLTPLDREHTVGRTLLPFMGIPVLWFLIVNTLRYAVAGHVRTIMLLLAVAGTYGFLFVLMRVLYLLVRRQDGARRATRIVVLFVLPLLGLMVTQLTPAFSFFWDFQSPVYYLLVVLNGVLMMLPQPQRLTLRLLLFFGRCTTYVMVLYFFVCLAPFYTLSFLGVLLFGLGVLVLAPLFLVLYQTRVLWESAKALLRDCGAVKTTAAGLVGLLLLPVMVAASFYGNRANFSKAVHYLTDNTAPAESDRGRVDIDALENSITFIRQGGGEMSFRAVSNYPYYYYSQDRIPPPLLTWLHNLVVDEEGYAESGAYDGLRALYFGASNTWTGYSLPVKVEGNDNVKLMDLQVETVREGDTYRSTVHLTIQEQTAVKEAARALEEAEPEFDGIYSWGMEEEPEDYVYDDYFDDYYSDYARRAEYATTIQLPQGVFVSDYYLDVLGERKSGLLAERSSAQWIYETVVSSMLDPGLVYYDGSDLVLRVFPFEENEVRYTGIELLHNGPVSFEIDGFTVELAPEASAPAAPVYGGGGAVYISAAVKNSLPAIQREPHYLFVVDCSRDAEVEEYAQRIRDYCERMGIAPEAATVTALNYRRASWPMTREDWEQQLLAFDREGGFAFGLVADALCLEFDLPDAYPVFVLVSDSLGSAILPQDTSTLEAVSPELYGYYSLPNQEPHEDGHIESPRLLLFQGSPLLDQYPGMDGSTSMRVLELDGARYYLHDDGRPEILWQHTGEAAALDYSQSGGSDWVTALNLMGDYHRSLEALGEERTAAQLELVKNSFRTGIMTPLTSLIVLETPAQEELMLERQRRLLESGDLERYIDMSISNEDWNNPDMAEPPLLACGVMAVVLLLALRRRRSAGGR